MTVWDKKGLITMMAEMKRGSQETKQKGVSIPGEKAWETQERVKYDDHNNKGNTGKDSNRLCLLSAAWIISSRGK